MSDVAEGSCLCGSVRFRISGEFEAFFLCHCSRCRKDTGSAHAANLFSSKASLEWLAGEASVKTYRLAGTRHEKSFCIECGSALPGREAGGAFIAVPAGSLDTPVSIRPTAHICFASRAEWDEDLAGVAKLDAMPG